MTDPHPAQQASGASSAQSAARATGDGARRSAEVLLETLEELKQYQVRAVAAEVVAAVAHAVGTPLNVISGRAELIRQDPSNALTQVGRIDDQVRKLANGLRQMVDYLSIAELSSAHAPVAEVLEEARALVRAVADRAGVELAVDASGAGGMSVERVPILSALTTLGSLAIRCASLATLPPAERRVRFSAVAAGGSLTFEVTLPGLAPVEGWHLEHFEARPAAGEQTEAHQVLSVCAALVRGRGGKLLLEPMSSGSGLVARFASRS